MSLLDNILDAGSGQPMKCPVGIYCMENPELGTELQDAIAAQTNGSYVVTAAEVSRYLDKKGKKISAPAIRTHRRHQCACPV